MTTGKWTEPGIPHRGWVCLSVYDLGEPAFICEMCEVMTIRYVHVMAHDDYQGELECGCICAGHMEEDLLRARDREKLFKARMSRRKNWLTRTWWRTLTGAHYLNTNHFHVSVWPNHDGTFAAKVQGPKRTRYSKRVYRSMDEAKLAAFDAMIGMSLT